MVAVFDDQTAAKAVPDGPKSRWGDFTVAPPLIHIRVDYQMIIHEHVREKTNNLCSEQVRHKPGCTVTEDG